MADYYGVNATKSLSPTADHILDPGVLGGKVRCMIDTYEAAGEAAAKTIQMGQTLPVGAKILGMTLAFDDLSAAGATISIGDAASSARYAAAIDVATAASYSVAILVDGLGYKITGTSDTEILLLIGVAAITGTVKLIVFYTVE